MNDATRAPSEGAPDVPGHETARGKGNGLRWRPMTARTFGILLVAYVVIRLFLAALPGYVNDVDSYKVWGEYAADVGLSRAYEAVPPVTRSPIDYPPVFVYVCWLVAHLERLRQGAADAGVSTFAIKLPHVLFDLAVGAILAWVVARRDLWRRGAGWEWGRWAAVLFWFSPAVLFGSGYWGQPDGVHSLFVVGSLALLTGGHGFAAGAMLSVGGLAKPLAGPFVPLLVLAVWRRGGVKQVVLSGIGGFLAAGLVFSPYFGGGRLVPTLERVLLDVDAMPFTTVNGHSIWWILRPWELATEPWPAALNIAPKTLALTAFALVLVWLLWSYGRRPARGQETDTALFTTAAAIAASFFALSTHMHENHLFTAIPLLAAVAGRSPRLLWLFVGASVASFSNMVLHDVDIPYALPGFLSAKSNVVSHHVNRYYTWLQLIGSFFNTFLVLAVAVETCRIATRRGGSGTAAGNT